MTDPDPSHGTRVRYRRGCRCCPCRAANAEAEADRRDDRRHQRQTLGQRISPIPARRRIKQLAADHVSERELAARLGLKHPSLRLYPDAITVRKHLRIAFEHRRLTEEGPDTPLDDAHVGQ